MKQDLVKRGSKKGLPYDKDSQLHRKIESLYKRLENTYGELELKRRANKIQVTELLDSRKVEDRMLALHRLIKRDMTLDQLPEDDLPAALESLEEMVIEDCARREIEAALQKRIQERVEERYNEYLREIEVQILKEANNTTENAQTLKKYAQLEKLERKRLNCSVLDLLRPSILEDIVGQEQAIRALIAKLKHKLPKL